jgi:osmoprotectant transport system ATP-binding protein
MIHLDGVSKHYAGTAEAAVEELTLDIPKGEVLVLVGPSGCGKSTTLRLINRMIEPSSGRIYFGGEDVTDVNPDDLRRRIGYVIQQIGLFPHRTIAENVATVPKLLGWPRSEIGPRVNELLEMVGLDPSVFARRYPKELSGGQAQRVGVARALGADPEVLLMDEPFGAIDPITRDRLQNEFLRLQAELRKTIVFVTHDVDEAIKMGDRIAILGQRSQLAQLDTPERILALPANDFVNDFTGSGSTLKGLHFERVRNVELADWPVLRAGADRSEALAILTASEEKWLLVLDEQNRPERWVNETQLAQTGTPLSQLGAPVIATVEPHATLHDALEEMLSSNAGTCVVIDGRGVFQGVIAAETLTGAVARMRAEAKRHYEELAVEERRATMTSTNGGAS